MATIKKMARSTSENVSKEESLSAVGGRVNWCGLCRSQYEALTGEQPTEPPLVPSYTNPGHELRNKRGNQEAPRGMVRTYICYIWMKHIYVIYECKLHTETHFVHLKKYIFLKVNKGFHPKSAGVMMLMSKSWWELQSLCSGVIYIVSFPTKLVTK